MASGVSQSVRDKLAAATQNILAQKTAGTTTATAGATGSATANPFNGAKIAELRAAKTTPHAAPVNMGVVPTYNERAVTNYGGKGSALNEILNSKKQYDAGVANGNNGLKSWAATNAQQYYEQLDPAEAAAVKGMNTQQLIDHIN